MDDESVLRRLDRVERLDRAGAPPAVLLEEVRLLLADAEAWARRAGEEGQAALEAVGRARSALAEGREPVHAL